MTREDIERRRGLGGSPESIYVWTEVVGVVADVRHAGLAGASRPLLYVPYRQTNWHNAQLIVRTSGDPLALAATVRAEVGAVNRNAIVTRVQTMEAAIGDSIARPRMATLLVGAFSTVGVLLAALGLYGIMAHGVVQRTREIGIRVALGATHGDVSWLILRQGFIVTLAGILIGLLGVTLTARVLGTLLYATSPVDPLALAIAILLLMAAALSAAYIPARRATGVDPIVALRDE
jgi:predicted lysophospholipase L1 biosynthesis ABC-type transport system permease subunit